MSQKHPSPGDGALSSPVARSYLHWLVAISLAFVLLERLFPWRKGQAPAASRPGPATSASSRSTDTSSRC